MAIGSGHPTPQVTQIKISEEERTSGVPKPLTIERALTALHGDGIVVLNNAIDTAHLDFLNARMDPEARAMLHMETTHFNGPDTGNVSQVPPLYQEYLFRDVFANPIGAAILSNILGPKPELRYLNGNTAMRGTKRQRVHADLLFEHLNFPFAMAINVLLVDTSVVNGSTEIWPGTHFVGSNKSGGLLIDLDELEKRRKECPPIQPTIPKGSLIIRDLRLWHAGIPNSTDDPRVMLAMVLFPAWYKNKMRLKFPKSSEERVKVLSKDINFVADFVPDEEFNHMTIQFEADFTGGNTEKTARDLELYLRYGTTASKDVESLSVPYVNGGVQ